MEQHADFGQVLFPLRAPHFPLVLTLLAADVFAGAAADVDVARTDVARTDVATVVAGVDAMAAGEVETALGALDAPAHLPNRVLQPVPQ